MRTLLLLGACLTAGVAIAADTGRYQAFPLTAGEAVRGVNRVFVLDSREGHIWVWSENELMTAPDGSRRYGTGFVYQGKLRPGTRPGEFVDPAR